MACVAMRPATVIHVARLAALATRRRTDSKKEREKRKIPVAIQPQLEPARYRISRNSSQEFALVDDERKALPCAMLLAPGLELLLFSSTSIPFPLLKTLSVLFRQALQSQPQLHSSLPQLSFSFAQLLGCSQLKNLSQAVVASTQTP